MAYMTRTPLRVSLFGGGTDYPEYFHRRPGAVLGFAIRHYIYITALKLRVPVDYAYRLSYSKLELTDTIDTIEHPVVRETLRLYGMQDHLDMNVMSDLPAAGGGLGSSSAFTVGFVNLVSSMLGKPVTKMDLARTAMRVERDILNENVGVQDQLHAAYGGVNRFDFEGDKLRISPVQIRGETMAAIERSMVLVHTGITRRATSVAAEQTRLTKAGCLDSDLNDLYGMVGEAVDLLEGSSDDVVPELGRRLVESWKIKRKLTSNITNDEIDRIYETALSVGAYGGKLCGAGGGGFMMMLVPPERIPALVEKLSPLTVLPTGIDMKGTTILSAGQNQRRPYQWSTPRSRTGLRVARQKQNAVDLPPSTAKSQTLVTRNLP